MFDNLAVIGVFALFGLMLLGGVAMLFGHLIPDGRPTPKDISKWDNFLYNESIKPVVVNSRQDKINEEQQNDTHQKGA
jgi:hypothetical protein